MSRVWSSVNGTVCVAEPKGAAVCGSAVRASVCV